MLLRLENVTTTRVFLPWLSAARARQQDRQHRDRDNYIAGLKRAQEDGVELNLEDLRDLVTSQQAARNAEVGRINIAMRALEKNHSGDYAAMQVTSPVVAFAPCTRRAVVLANVRYRLNARG
jgi:hypothetical protein